MNTDIPTPSTTPDEFTKDEIIQELEHRLDMMLMFMNAQKLLNDVNEQNFNNLVDENTKLKKDNAVLNTYCNHLRTELGHALSNWFNLRKSVRDTLQVIQPTDQ